MFDTANPIFNPDRSKPKPWPKQDPWEFWEHVRDHSVHIHVKDATWNAAKNDADYNWPGEGQGRVRDILKDAISTDDVNPVRIETIQRVVALKYSVDVKDLKGQQRTASIALPRQVAMYLSCVMSELSSTDIGRAFGGKDHSTVLHARKK